MSWPFRLPFGELAPWGDLTLRRQSIDSYSIADPYLGEVRFGAAEADETVASLGLTLEADPVTFGDDGELSLRASAGYRRSLAREDWKVEITEGLATREETVARPRTEEIEAGAEIGLRLGDALSLSATYSLTRELEGTLDHYLFGELRFTF